MPANKTRTHVDDLRGASRLAVEATKNVTDLVQAMHVTIAGGPDILGRPLEGPVRFVTGIVYGSIRGVTKLVGSGIDIALEQLAPLLGESVPGPERAAVLAALNGVLGDYLAESGNPLATEMRLCKGGVPLDLERDALRDALPGAGAKLLVMVHGSSMNDEQWNWRGHDHGAALEADLGYTAVYLRYNSGLHISTNGRAFAAMLEQLVGAWPVPLEDFVIVGHSMGGLVARSACHAGDEACHEWRRRLRKLVCVGSPHHGAPLERGGSVLELLLGISRYSAPFKRLARLRSAGVTDMRYGIVEDAHWAGRDRFAYAKDPRDVLRLPDGVECYAIAGTMSPSPSPKLRSDGLVPVESALGRNEKATLTLAFPETHQWIGFGIGHLDLLNRSEVYETLASWLR